MAHPANSNRLTKVFVQRDYSEGTAVKFQKKFPLELEGKVSRVSFEQTVEKINQIFLEAEKTDAGSLFRGCCACLTGYMLYCCVDTHYEKSMKKLAHYVYEQNETLYNPKGLMVTSPMERGLRVIEIEIL
jgi:Golgin subfamily A member 7/ERF4 family.